MLGYHARSLGIYPGTLCMLAKPLPTSYIPTLFSRSSSRPDQQYKGLSAGLKLASQLGVDASPRLLVMMWSAL